MLCSIAHVTWLQRVAHPWEARQLFRAILYPSEKWDYLLHTKPSSFPIRGSSGGFIPPVWWAEVQRGASGPGRDSTQGLRCRGVMCSTVLGTLCHIPFTGKMELLGWLACERFPGICSNISQDSPILQPACPWEPVVARGFSLSIMT